MRSSFSSPRVHPRGPNEASASSSPQRSRWGSPRVQACGCPQHAHSAASCTAATDRTRGRTTGHARSIKKCSFKKRTSRGDGVVGSSGKKSTGPDPASETSGSCHANRLQTDSSVEMSAEVGPCSHKLRSAETHFLSRFADTFLLDPRQVSIGCMSTCSLSLDRVCWSGILGEWLSGVCT